MSCGPTCQGEGGVSSLLKTALDCSVCGGGAKWRISRSDILAGPHSSRRISTRILHHPPTLFNLSTAGLPHCQSLTPPTLGNIPGTQLEHRNAHPRRHFFNPRRHFDRFVYRVLCTPLEFVQCQAPLSSGSFTKILAFCGDKPPPLRLSRQPGSPL